MCDVDIRILPKGKNLIHQLPKSASSEPYAHQSYAEEGRKKP